MKLHIPILTVLIVSSFALFGAIAPMTPMDLEKNSDLIITGKVIGMTSKITKSKVEKAFGIHRDKIFKVTIKITKILKGKGVKLGQNINIGAWQPRVRIPPYPGPQGNQLIPNKSDFVKVYLYVKSENNYTALLPNGFKIKTNK
ncbi:hypothetical protein N8603_02305 [Verrucomicrobiales bacterium]|nr:hypothetical protein [Verrucomicrobiales bacterium]